MDVIGFIIYIFSSSATPGPNTVSSMTSGVQVGFKRTIPYLCGMYCGLTIISVLSAIFLKNLQNFIESIKFYFLIVAAAYILYLAYKTYRSGDIKEREVNPTFKQGLTLQFVNPKVYLYLIMSLETYIVPVYKDDIIMLLFFALVLSTFAIMVDITYCLIGSSLKVFYNSNRKLINTILALALVYCAIKLFL